MVGKALKKIEGMEAIALQNRASIAAIEAHGFSAAERPQRVTPLQTLSEMRALDEQLRSRARFSEMVRKLSEDDNSNVFYINR